MKNQEILTCETARALCKKIRYEFLKKRNDPEHWRYEQNVPYLFVEGSRIVMLGNPGRHSLEVSCSSESRVRAHYHTFQETANKDWQPRRGRWPY
jgi:hypothetical protein